MAHGASTTSTNFAGGSCPPFLRGPILHPPFLNFGPVGNALKLPMASPLLLT